MRGLYTPPPIDPVATSNGSPLAQHTGYRSNGSSAATDVIKRFISDGQVGLGLFGNEQAAELLPSNKQLSHWLRPPCDTKPLRLEGIESLSGFSTPSAHSKRV